MGQYAIARDYLEEALDYDVQTPKLRLLAATVGIPLGLLLNDHDILTRVANPETIDLAFESGESAKIADIVAAFAAYYVARDRKRQAQTLLHRIPWVLGEFASGRLRVCKSDAGNNE